MIVTRTPLRVSFVGGGSDMASYYREQPGSVLSCTINQYVYVTVNKKFDGAIRVSYSKTENVNFVHELEHDIVRSALYHFEIEGGIEITSVSDIPGEGTGLGSSSAFTVGLVNALAAFKGRTLSKAEAAEIACHIEIHMCAHIVGKQDQYASSFGGFNVFTFEENGGVDVRPLEMPKPLVSLLSNHLCLLYTGKTRRSSGILAHQHCRNEDGQNRETLTDMVHQVTGMARALNKDPNLIPGILNEAWRLKKQLTPEITTPEIDQLFEAAKSHGAEGGKLLGAGGGGFLLLWRDPKHENRLPFQIGLRDLDFEFDFDGSTIVYTDN